MGCLHCTTQPHIIRSWFCTPVDVWTRWRDLSPWRPRYALFRATCESVSGHLLTTQDGGRVSTCCLWSLMVITYNALFRCICYCQIQRWSADMWTRHAAHICRHQPHLCAQVIHRWRERLSIIMVAWRRGVANIAFVIITAWCHAIRLWPFCLSACPYYHTMDCVEMAKSIIWNFTVRSNDAGYLVLRHRISARSLSISVCKVIYAQ